MKLVVPHTKHPIAQLLSLLLLLLFFGPAAKTQVPAPFGEKPALAEGATILEVTIEVAPMAASLLLAPPEAQTRAMGSTALVALPMPDGSWASYRVLSSPMLSEAFAQQQPDFKTYSLFTADKGQYAGRLFLSNFGVSALVFWGNGLVTINPVDYSKTTLHRVSYTVETEPFECGTESEGLQHPHKKPKEQRNGFTPNGANKRTYDMAIVTTGEFYQAYGTTAAASAAVTTAVSNINAIYRRDLATEFSLLTPVHYTDPGTDPFNPAGSNRPEQAAAGVHVNFAIGTYDIGHCLHHIANGGSGVAYLGVVCENDTIFATPPAGFSNNGSYKAGGWSGGNAVSSGFIGLFAHEVGHMFMARHTFNGSESNCGPNISSINAYEIGSGSSIMSYSGICGSQNVPSSGLNDNYFHGKSLEAMIEYMEDFGTCATLTATTNAPPTVNANPCGGSYTLPKRTPFTLTGSGTDADDDEIYYTWEQIDEDGAGTPTQGFIGTTAGNSAIAPLFRSYPPTPDADRTFPALPFILNNANVDNFEPLPNAARTLHFRLTGRDFLAVGGVSCSDMQVTVSATAGPLTVTAPNGGENWSAGSHTVTWLMNNTNTICANVDILLSLDGGLSFPVELLLNTPNDGSQSITLPELPTTLNARVKVRCRVNACFEFFDLSNASFDITSDCDAAATRISPDNAVTYPAGDPNLDFTLSNNFGTVVPNLMGTLATTDASGSLVFLDGMSLTCTVFSNPTNYDTYLFSVDVTGDYTFNKSVGAFGIMMNLYEFDFIGSNCTNHIGSSGQRPFGTGPITLFNSVTAALTANQTYYLMVGSFGSGFPALPANYTITFTKPAGSNVYNGVINPAGFSYGYFAVNTANGELAAFSAGADFTALPAGSYCIYGASYKTSGAPPPANVDPLTLIGLTIDEVLDAGHCINFSTNCKPVTVTGGGSCSLSSTGLGNVQCNNNGTPTNGADDYITFQLNPVGLNLAATYNVTVSAGTVTPTSGSYGGPVSFNMQAGSANGGNFTVTVTDASGGTCSANAAVTNPATTYYRDLDGDTFGNPAVTLKACSQPSGYVANNTDCDDNDANEKPGQTWYRDLDGDDYSNGTSLVQCLRPTNYFTTGELIATSGDCNDGNSGINPAATEVCDGTDDDCDTFIDEGVTTTYYRDLDGDGFGNPAVTQQACSQPSGYVANNTDCDDNDANEKPGQTWYLDADGDDYSNGTSLVQCLRPANYFTAGELTATTGDCNDGNSGINPAATEVCNGTDDDCDTFIDEGVTTTYYRDLDGDGFGNPAVTQQACSQPSGYVANNTDCDDNDANEKPGQTWYLDADGDDYSNGTSLVQCLRPTNYFTAGELTATSGDCNDGNSGINPAATEVCNGIDDDCDTFIDEGVTTTYYRDLDGDGFGNPAVTQQACSQPSGYVANNTDCDDNDANEKPGQTWYLDADGDDYSNGTSLVQCLRPTNYFTTGELTATSGDCNDGNSGINPAATEVCNGTDDDCDTFIDEGVTTTYYADPDGDGFGDPATPQAACSQPVGFVADNTDNCPVTFNPDQDDDDNNGEGDICQNCPPNLTIYPYAPVQVSFEAQQNIVTSGAVTVLNTTTRIYQAGTGITLNAGFEVQLGAVFDAINQACTPLQGEEEQE